MAGEGWFLHYIDDKVADWLECDDTDALLGHQWTDYVHPDDQQLTVNAANSLQAGTIPAPFSQRWLTSAGREILLQIEVWSRLRASGVWTLVGRFTNLCKYGHTDQSLAVSRQERCHETRAASYQVGSIDDYLSAGFEYFEGRGQESPKRLRAGVQSDTLITILALVSGFC